MTRELREVVYVDGVRTACGKAGPKVVFWRTQTGIAERIVGRPLSERAGAAAS